MSNVLARRTFVRGAAAAVGCGLMAPLLAACGGSAAPIASPAASSAGGTAAAGAAGKPAAPSVSGSAAASPAASASSSAAAKAAVKVSYALASINGLHYVATIGREKPDLPARRGVQFDLVETTNSPNAMNAMVGGSVNFAAVTPDTAWPAQDKAPDVKQVMPVADGTPYAVIAQPDVKKAADLKGKTFGASAVKGGADTTAIMVMMLENGVPPGAYTIVQAGNISERTSAMKAKAIQALAQLEPQATALRDAGFPEIDNANNYPALKGVHTIVLTAKQSWYQANAELAANFLRAWNDITKWIYDPANKDQVLAITKKAMSASSDKAAENTYNLHVGTKSVTPDPQFNPKYMQQFIDNLKRTGASNLPADPMKYVDGSLVQKALAA